MPRQRQESVRPSLNPKPHTLHPKPPAGRAARRGNSRGASAHPSGLPRPAGFIAARMLAPAARAPPERVERFAENFADGREV
jgi:hypothetical protein